MFVINFFGTFATQIFFFTLHLKLNLPWRSFTKHNFISAWYSAFVKWQCGTTAKPYLFPFPHPAGRLLLFVDLRTRTLEKYDMRHQFKRRFAVLWKWAAISQTGYSEAMPIFMKHFPFWVLSISNWYFHAFI